MLNGETEILILQAEGVKIHESPFWNVVYTTKTGDTPHGMRVNAEAFYPNPQPGDRVRVNFIMGSVMGATLVEKANG